MTAVSSRDRILPSSLYTGEGVTASLEKITPTTAAWMLEAKNGINPRKLSKMHVARIAANLLASGFPVTGESIVLDRDGNILDGQHRLAAIVKSGVTALVVVTRGVHPDARYIIDSQQRIRSIAHLLEGAGVINTNSIAALASMVRLYLDRPNCSASSIIGKSGLKSDSGSRATMQAWVLERNDALQAILHLARECPNTKHLGGYRYIAFAPAVSAIEAWGTDDGEAALTASCEYLTGLSTVANLSEGDSRICLLRYGGGLRGGPTGSPSSYRESLLHVCVSAWNSWIEGRSITKLQRPRMNIVSISTYRKVLSTE